MKEEKSIELDQSDFKENKQAKKSGSGLGLKLTCGFLALATLGLGAFVIYDKFFATQPEKTETSVSNQTLVEEKSKVSNNDIYVYNTDEQELYDLFDRYIQGSECGDGFEFGAQLEGDAEEIFSSKTVNLKNMTKTDIAWDIFWNAVNAHENLNSYDSVNFFLTKDELTLIKNKLFGKKFDFDIDTMHTLAKEWNWDSDKKVLYFQAGWGGTCPLPPINTKIVKAQKTDTSIEIFVRRLGDDEKGFYKYKDGNKQYVEKGDLSVYATGVGSSNDYYVLTASDMRKGNLYKVTFEQDPDDSKNFIFKSSEILE